MVHRKIGITLVAFLLSLQVLAQQPTGQKNPMDFPLGGKVVVGQIEVDYAPKLQNLEAPAPGGTSYRDWLETRKAELFGGPGQNTTSKKLSGSAPAVNVNRNFQANLDFEGVPNDNAFAISNGGKVMSAVNSNVLMTDMDGNMLHDTMTGDSGLVSLEAFSDTLGLTATMYDPKLLYDPNSDRFIMVHLAGFTDSTSNIVVSFSQSNDPLGEWNLYSLPGNPRNNGTWSDYPMIAITEQELFLTVNAIITGAPWETGFEETYIWQINLDDGYTGDTLSTNLWTGCSIWWEEYQELVSCERWANAIWP